MEYDRSSEGPARGISRRGYSERRSGPIPVKEGEEYEVKIDATDRKGDGIARIQNFIIFAPETKAGDQVRVRITGVGGSFATASVLT